MSSSVPLLLFGASVRAAAFSALRAGLQPQCADLFADEDLRARCPAARSVSQYPHGFLKYAREEGSGPWMYTGGLENWPELIQHIAAVRPLWGNDESVLHKARSPHFVTELLSAAGLPVPAMRGRPDGLPRDGSWLVKPLHSSGGGGIDFWKGRKGRRKHVYYQVYVAGEPCAALYVSDGWQAHLLGVTRQLIGEAWLHAAPFHYCGSVGPLALNAGTRRTFERLGQVLTTGCGLRGIFGVDCILRDGVPWPVEVNPRYTASVEVLEYATGTAALALHRAVFDPAASVSSALAPSKERGVGGEGVGHAREGGPLAPCDSTAFIGKAVLFAQAPLTFPAEGPWLSAFRMSDPIDDLPAFADIPAAGQKIGAGRPVLTLFARGQTASACLDRLQSVAEDLDRRLFSR
jgi:predicted ATP-grasp superfamily ATP-dependent carboligase